VRRGRWWFFLSGLIFGPLLAVISIGLGLWPWRGTSVPPTWENTFATKALHTALAREAKNLKSPLPASEDTLRAGMKIYRTNCAGCHGDFNQPSAWGANGFYPRVPQFANAPSTLRSEEMFLVVRNGVRYSGMGAWKDLMSEAETWKVVMFLSNIRSLPPAVKSEWEAGRDEKK
jgi:mono/diheme cytochrome c family protein